MRVIKLAKEEFPLREDVDEYFRSPESDFHRRGFIFPKGRIAEDGVQPGEIVVFTYNAQAAYLAEATGPREDYDGPECPEKPFRLPLDTGSLEAIDVSLHDLLCWLGFDSSDAQRLTQSQGWLRLGTDVTTDDLKRDST